MTRPLAARRLAPLLFCGCAVLAMGACGKRGNPMPPLQRIPAGPRDLAVTRLDDQVFIRFTVPTTNVDGVQPADVARVDLYAITLDRDPKALSELNPEELRKLSTLVGSEQVRRPVPPPPPVKEGMPPVPVPPPAPGIDQGAVMVVREALTSETHTPATVPEAKQPRPQAIPEPDVPRALIAPSSTAGPQRYYYGVAISARGRHGPHSGLLAVPLGPTSSAPSQPTIDLSETTMTVKWTPPEDARGQTVAIDPELLPSRSLVATPPATSYDVYEVALNESADAPLVVPKPLTESPVSASEFTQQNITLGAERCFVVRAVDVVDGVNVRGPASPQKCGPFTDTFPPAPPRDLLAASVPGAITLIWEASEAKDVAGYLVLRAEAGSDTLTALTTTPTTALRYRDETVQGGTRYVYAIVAIDKPGNRSEESNRAEETAR